MDKLLTYAGKTEKGVFNFLIDYDSNYLIKTASEFHPTIASYINSAKKIPGKTQLLLTALGASEFWGDNVNGDAFPESELAHEGNDYGFKTFEHYAKYYKHHVNKDPKLSYGDVLLAVYNPVYHRVELIVAIDHNKAPDIIAKIENNETVYHSMGCLRKDAVLLGKDFYYKKISEITADDEVINAFGTVSKVDYAHNHHHKGTWYFIDTIGRFEECEPTTEEHPWLILPKEQTECLGNIANKMRKCGTCTSRRTRKKTCIGCEHISRKFTPTWCRADQLSVGDFIGTPILKGESAKPEDRYAYLAGLYLAQGHINSVGNRLILSVNASHYHLAEKLEKLYPEYTWCWAVRQSSANAGTIECTVGYDLCQKLSSDCGNYAHHKHLSPDLMLWPIESQKIFLGGYIDGDGGVYKDAIYISTCNKILSNQVFHVLLRVGCISDINIITHKPSTIVKKCTVEYQVWVGSTSTHILKDYSFKSKNIQPPKTVQGKKFIEDGYLWSPIIDIETEECDEVVYNVAMKSGDYDTDSYLVNNYALHNCKIPYDICSICGNKAPNRKHYCEHLRFMLGRIDPSTGRKVYAINIRPRFFDISYVLIPADKTAMGLRKVASSIISLPQHILDVHGNIIGSAEQAEKMASYKDAAIAKLAEMEKEIPLEAPSSTDLLESVRAKVLGRTIIETKDRERMLPNHVLNRMCEVASIPEILSTLAACMIMPKPQEFQRIILISRGHGEEADKLHRLNACFNPSSYNGPITPELEDAVGLNDENVRADLAEMLQPYFNDRSYTAPLLVKRMSVMVKQAEQDAQRPIYIDKDPKDESSLMKSLGLGAALYTAFNMAASKSPNMLLELIKKHPLMATALGVGLYTTLSTNSEYGSPYKGRFSGTEAVISDSTDIYDRIERMRERPYTKVAGATDQASRNSAMLRRLLIGVPAVQMVSGALQSHKGSHPGEDEGRISGLIRKHPNLISGVLVADALLARHGKGSYPLTHSVHEVQSKWLKGEPLMKSAGIVASEEVYPGVKSASAQDYLSSSVIWPLAVGGGNLPGRIVGSLFDQAALDIGQKLIEKSNQRKANNGQRKF